MLNDCAIVCFAETTTLVPRFYGLYNEEQTTISTASMLTYMDVLNAWSSIMLDNEGFISEDNLNKRFDASQRLLIDFSIEPPFGLIHIHGGFVYTSALKFWIGYSCCFLCIMICLRRYFNRQYNVEDSVVRVQRDGFPGGSGFIVSNDPLYVITCAHVLERDKNQTLHTVTDQSNGCILVTCGNTVISVPLVNTFFDRTNDIAIIFECGSFNLPPLPVSRKKSTDIVKTTMRLVGYPGTQSLCMVTDIHVQSIEIVTNIVYRHEMRAMQSVGSQVAGMSGGAVIANDNRVCGIAFQGAPTIDQPQSEIPVETLLIFLNDFSRKNVYEHEARRSSIRRSICIRILCFLCTHLVFVCACSYCIEKIPTTTKYYNSVVWVYALIYGKVLYDEYTQMWFDLDFTFVKNTIL